MASKAKKAAAAGALVRYGVSSTYFKGECCPSVQRGHSWDEKKDKLQIVFRTVTQPSEVSGGRGGIRGPYRRSQNARIPDPEAAPSRPYIELPGTQKGSPYGDSRRRAAVQRLIDSVIAWIESECTVTIISLQ